VSCGRRLETPDDFFSPVVVVIVTLQGESTFEGRAAVAGVVSTVHLLVPFSSGATAFVLFEHIGDVW